VIVPERSIVPDLIQQLHRLQAVGQAADRALIRLTHPTINPETVPEEIVRVIVTELSDALGQLERDDLEAVPAIAAAWSTEPTTFFRS
jgi:hypothetical protein